MKTKLIKGSLTGGFLVVLFLVVGAAGFLIGRYAATPDPSS